MYALAVHQLSEAIAQAREEVAQSTTADPARTALRAPASAQPIVNGGAG